MEQECPIVCRALEVYLALYWMQVPKSCRLEFQESPTDIKEERQGGTNWERLAAGPFPLRSASNRFGQADTLEASFLALGAVHRAHYLNLRNYARPTTDLL